VHPTDRFLHLLATNQRPIRALLADGEAEEWCERKERKGEKEMAERAAGEAEGEGQGEGGEDEADTDTDTDTCEDPHGALEAEVERGDGTSTGTERVCAAEPFILELDMVKQEVQGKTQRDWEIEGEDEEEEESGKGKDERREPKGINREEEKSNTEERGEIGVCKKKKKKRMGHSQRMEQQPQQSRQQDREQLQRVHMPEPQDVGEILEMAKAQAQDEFTRQAWERLLQKHTGGAAEGREEAVDMAEVQERVLGPFVCELEAKVKEARVEVAELERENKKKTARLRTQVEESIRDILGRVSLDPRYNRVFSKDKSLRKEGFKTTSWKGKLNRGGYPYYCPYGVCVCLFYYAHQCVVICHHVLSCLYV
jgi:hypothetical protein